MTMKRSIVTSVLLLGLAVVGVLSAHDESKHKGNATKGEIVAVADDSFVMKTPKGNVTVTLNEDTKIEHGEQAVDKTHLMKGEEVTVFGTKLPSGQLVAKEVVMGAAEAGKPKTEHKHDVQRCAGDHPCVCPPGVMPLRLMGNAENVRR